MPATYPYDMQLRDARSIKRFIESRALYKSGRFLSLRGEAYDAGSRLAVHLLRERPTTADALADIAVIATGIRIDREKRKRHFEAIANSAANVAAREAAYARLGLRIS